MARNKKKEDMEHAPLEQEEEQTLEQEEEQTLRTLCDALQTATVASSNHEEKENIERYEQRHGNSSVTKEEKKTKDIHTC